MIDQNQQEMSIRQSTRGHRARSVRRLAGVAVAGMALTLAACSSSGSASSTTAAPSGGGTATTAAPSGGGATATTIVIRNFAFSPATITVSAGATVTVTNEDSVAHTITSSKGGFDTGNILPHQSKTFTAPKTAGSYPYICSIHQYMSGTLTVS